MKNKWWLLLLVLTFIKGIAWVILTPIFQAPDENVHWGVIQYISEKLKTPTKRDIITSRELSTVAKIVRFNWVESHPVWQGLEENWKEKLNQINPLEKSEFSFAEKQGGHKLPQGYFWLGSIFYRLFFNQSFLVRFYALRFISVVLSVITVYIIYRASRLMLKAPISLAVAFMVAMQPMYSAISSAVTYDSLAVLVVSAYTFFSLKFIKSKEDKWQWLALLTAVAGILVKTQLVGLIFIWPFLLTKKQRIFWLLLPLGIVILLQFRIFQQLWNEALVWLRHEPMVAIGSYFQQNYRSLSAEVFPWYWGVFGWLEKTMPLWVYRVLKIMVGLSVLGLVKFFYFFRKQAQALRQSVAYLLLTGTILAGVVMVNDFIIFTQRGSGFGVQGRYFIPGIAADMILLVLGLSQLMKPSGHKFLVPGIIVSSLLLNLIGLFTIYEYFGCQVCL